MLFLSLQFFCNKIIFPYIILPQVIVNKTLIKVEFLYLLNIAYAFVIFGSL